MVGGRGQGEDGRQKVSKQTNKYVIFSIVYELENHEDTGMSGLLNHCPEGSPPKSF